MWVTYFTSSKIVKKLIKDFGKNSFKTEIRRTFSSKEAAIVWEEKVLRRLSVHKKENWINTCVSKSIRYHVHPRLGVKLSEATKNKISKSNTGKIRSKNDKDKMSEQRSGKNHWNYGKTLSEEVKQKIRDSNLNFIKNNPDKKQVPPSPLGRKVSAETREKMSLARKKFWEDKKKEVLKGPNYKLPDLSYIKE